MGCSDGSRTRFCLCPAAWVPGYPASGSDASYAMNSAPASPLECGLGFAVKLNKEKLPGKAALSQPQKRIRIGIKVTDEALAGKLRGFPDGEKVGILHREPTAPPISHRHGFAAKRRLSSRNPHRSGREGPSGGSGHHPHAFLQKHNKQNPCSEEHRAGRHHFRFRRVRPRLE